MIDLAIVLATLVICAVALLAVGAVLVDDRPPAALPDPRPRLDAATRIGSSPPALRLVRRDDARVDLLIGKER